MVSQVMGNFNRLENNKKLLTENHFSENNNYINEKEEGQFTPEDFKKEGYRVKEKLQNKINDFIPESSLGLISDYSLKEEAIINRNKYARNSNNARILEQEISKIQYADSKINSRSNSNADSLNDFFKEVRDSIITGKNDYLDILKDVFSKYMDYVNELRTILSELSELTKAGAEDGTVNVDFKTLSDKLYYLKIKFFGDDIIKEYLFKINLKFTKDGNGYYRMVNGEKIYYKDNTQVDAAVKAIEDLLKGVKGIELDKKNNSTPPDIEFTFGISIDFSDLDKVISDLEERSKNKGDILQSEFNLFKNSLDALEKKINTNLDELSKKYSAANSNYDNFVKIVSSTMNSLLEMAKGFLRF